MRDFVDDVQLFDGDLVDFVQDINAGDVNSVRERDGVIRREKQILRERKEEGGKENKSF